MLESIETYFDAILYAWHGGNRTVTAVADILFGNICPSGKAAVTFPRVTGHVPIYYNFLRNGKRANGYYGADGSFDVECGEFDIFTGKNRLTTDKIRICITE